MLKIITRVLLVLTLTLSFISFSAFADGSTGATKVSKSGSEYKEVKSNLPSEVRKSTKKKRKTSAWGKFKKEHIPYYGKRKTTPGFWVSKIVRLFELYLLICISTIIAISLEILGVIKFIAPLLSPFVKLGRLNDQCVTAFLSSFRNGSVGNSVLVAAKDNDLIDKRQLYTSVLVVSSIATLGHMPSFILAMGAICGKEALIATLCVRVGAVIAQIACVLTFSGLVVRPLMKKSAAVEDSKPIELTGIDGTNFFQKVFKRSKKTIKRVTIYLTISYLVVSLGEFYGFFKVVFEGISSVIDLSFLPSAASVIIPAQFASVHSALGVAGSFIQSGEITPKEVVTIILIGSMVTSPLRTIKRIMPTYVGLLGVKAGPILGVSAQILRMSFLAMGLAIMWVVW